MYFASNWSIPKIILFSDVTRYNVVSTTLEESNSSHNKSCVQHDSETIFGERQISAGGPILLCAGS